MKKFVPSGDAFIPSIPRGNINLAANNSPQVWSGLLGQQNIIPRAQDLDVFERKQDCTVQLF